jgi:uncharacterized membrane protein YfcA
MKSLFHSSGMDWWVYLLLVPAGFLAGGSMLGAWAATHEAAVRGAPFIRRLLIAVVLASAIRYLFF